MPTRLPLCDELTKSDYLRKEAEARYTLGIHGTAPRVVTAPADVNCGAIDAEEAFAPAGRAIVVRVTDCPNAATYKWHAEEAKALEPRILSAAVGLGRAGIADQI